VELVSSLEKRSAKEWTPSITMVNGDSSNKENPIVKLLGAWFLSKREDILYITNYF